MKAGLFALLLALAGSAAWAVEVIDATGRTVHLEQPAQRIVALAPHVVENAFSAGAGERLVGAVSYSNYPAAARDIPRVGSYQAWSLESIVAKNPDLVLMWGSGNSLEGLPALEQLGIAVYISEPKRLEDIPATLRAIGQLAGTGDVAERNALAFEEKLARLRENVATGPARRVFYEVWNQPLQTINGDQYLSDVITLCGGRNIFADSPHIAPRISVEAVLARDPEIIIASGMGDARPEWLDDWQAYPHLTAVRNKALFFIHPDLLQRPTTRLLDGAQTLCEQIASQR
ncbi:cobalamin-binding protein [Parahaliea aestuarii]|uniref:Cobalamin-binding protein n=1 Tax=Parahaliea aestuarii TaxID=1852021 RepID=A0A5C8ZUW0_9GAMM|nr:cobalamin-binding protein [Parahaliea aestuarii]TXS91544.1 cobalamin-binding protein [Parahaliea aestuarii]